MTFENNSNIATPSGFPSSKFKDKLIRTWKNMPVPVRIFSLVVLTILSPVIAIGSLSLAILGLFSLGS